MRTWPPWSHACAVVLTTAVCTYHPTIAPRPTRPHTHTPPLAEEAIKSAVGEAVFSIGKNACMRNKWLAFDKTSKLFTRKVHDCLPTTRVLGHPQPIGTCMRLTYR